MAEQTATPQAMNNFVEIVDDFMANYSKLIAPETRDAVYASNDPSLIADYQSAVNKSDTLKSTIEATTGAWNSFKQGYHAVTDVTSTYIGDAVDWVRGIFGYNPAPGISGLGIAQYVLPAIWVAGIVAAAYTLNRVINNVFIAIEASKIQRENPSVSREQALAVASKTYAPPLFGGSSWMLYAALAAGVYLLWQKKR